MAQIHAGKSAAAARCHLDKENSIWQSHQNALTYDESDSRNNSIHIHKHYANKCDEETSSPMLEVK